MSGSAIAAAIGSGSSAAGGWHFHFARLTSSQAALLLFFGVAGALCAIIEVSRLYFRFKFTSDELERLEIESGMGSDIEARDTVKTPRSMLVDFYIVCHHVDTVALCRAFTILGSIMAYLFVAEETDVLGSIPRHHTRDFFAFLMIALFLAFLPTMRDAEDDKILGRDQTEEWKGWMQIGFLAYHYFHAKETYNMIRVFIAAYVWMTGFGHFSYFWLKEDFSLTRLARMLWRLNFTVVFVCLSLNRPYMLYYICPMHTFWFLCVYVVMYIKSERNKAPDGIFIRGKLIIFFVFCLVIFNTRSYFPAFDVLFSPLRFLLAYENKPGQGASFHEWFFRTRLDHFATLTGMLSAYFYPNFESWMKGVEAGSRTRQIVTKSALAIVILFVLSHWWSTCLMIPSKFDYNAQHPYTSMIPVLGYIILRNLTPKLRLHYIHGLTVMGKITLETYILQFHGIMKHNAKVIIDYVPNYPYVNIIVGSALFVLMSHALFKLTIKISTILLVRNQLQLTSNVLVILLTWSAFYTLGAGITAFASAYANTSIVLVALVELVKAATIGSITIIIAILCVRQMFLWRQAEPQGVLRNILFL